jgi:hypothetical protein
MSDNRIPLSVFEAHVPPTAAARPSLRARLTARLRADHYDHALAVGVRAPAGSALAAHAARVTSVAELEAVARTLRTALIASRDGTVFTSRAPWHAANINAAAGLIDAIALRLHAPRPVSARGMARLRRVLADGRGPFYRFGHGDLAGRLGAALAAL